MISTLIMATGLLLAITVILVARPL